MTRGVVRVVRHIRGKAAPPLLTALVPLLATAGAAAGVAPAPAHAATDAERRAAISWAVRQAGLHEIGTTNCSPQIDRWTRGMGLHARPCRPWCGTFVHEAYRQAGVRLSARLVDPDRTYADVIAGRRGLRAIPRSSVRPGDLLLFHFHGNVRASHIALVRTRPRRGVVRTVEGNISHAVHLKRRGVRYAVLAARVTAG